MSAGGRWRDMGGALGTAAHIGGGWLVLLGQAVGLILAGCAVGSMLLLVAVIAGAAS